MLTFLKQQNAFYILIGRIILLIIITAKINDNIPIMSLLYIIGSVLSIDLKTKFKFAS